MIQEQNNQVRASIVLYAHQMDLLQVMETRVGLKVPDFSEIAYVICY